MYRKDQIKGIIALLLFSIIGITFWLSGEEDVSLYVSLGAFGIWLVSMYWLNRRDD
jgi:hypothetical protein